MYGAPVKTGGLSLKGSRFIVMDAVAELPPESVQVMARVYLGVTSRSSVPRTVMVPSRSSIRNGTLESKKTYRTGMPSAWSSASVQLTCPTDSPDGTFSGTVAK